MRSEEKVQRLTAKLAEQFKELVRLEKKIRESFQGLGLL